MIFFPHHLLAAARHEQPLVYRPRRRHQKKKARKTRAGRKQDKFKVQQQKLAKLRKIREELKHMLR